MSLEQALVEHATALNRNSDLLERVVAGQEAAIAKLEGTKAPTTRTRAKKDDLAPPQEPAEQAVSEKAPEKAAEPAALALTQDDLKAVAMDWRNSTTDEAARKKQNELFQSIAAHLGVSKMTGPEGPSDPEHIKQAIFFIKRAAAGLPVDFAADYDFDGSPDQGASAAPAEDDPFA